MINQNRKNRENHLVSNEKKWENSSNGYAATLIHRHWEDFIDIEEGWCRVGGNMMSMYPIQVLK